MQTRHAPAGRGPLGRPRARFARIRGRLDAILAERRGFVVIIAAASLVAGLAEAGVLALVAQIAGAMSTGDDRAPLAFGPISLEAATPTLLIVATGLAALRLVLSLVLARLPAKVSGEVQTKLRLRLYDAYLGTSRAQRDAMADGHLHELMGGHMAQAGNSLLQLATGVATGLTFLTLVVAALVLSVAVAVAVIITALLLFVGLRPLSRSVRRHSSRTAKAAVAQGTGIADAVRLSEEIEVFGVEDTERERMRMLVVEHERAYVRTRVLSRAIPMLYQSAVVYLLIAGLALAYLVDAREFADLGAVVLLLVRASSYGQQFQSAYQAFGESLPYVDALDDAIGRLESERVAPGLRDLEHVDDLELQGLSFAYPGSKLVLVDIDARIGAGEFIGVVGPSGAGKSTLVQLLLRLREPTSGAYLVNGAPASEYESGPWRRRVTYLPQEPRLLDGTVEENIRFHRPWISREEVERAARLAHIEEEILGWDQGYDTVIGHRVDAVSGGQRQRICMARALAGRPDLLVLDEPTSALDARSDRAISETLGALRGSVTMVVVAHRASTLQLCDKIMVVRDGRVDAFDTPERVIEQSAFYRSSLGSGADWSQSLTSLESAARSGDDPR